MMESFTSDLNFIKQWLKDNQPNAYNALQDGLSSTDIDRLLDSLPFFVPEEVKCLYRWHNGMKLTMLRHDCQLFPYYRFNPLEKAIRLRPDVSHLRPDVSFLDEIHFEYELHQMPQSEYEIMRKHSGVLNNYLLPLFSFYEQHICLLGKSDKTESSPLIWICGEMGLGLMYDDLRSMFKTIRTCYEVGAYYDFYDPGVDEELEEQIRNRYNRLGRELGS